MSNAFKILVCIDLEHTAERLIAAAVDMCAGKPGSELHVVSVSEMAVPSGMPFAPTLPGVPPLSVVDKERLVAVTRRTLDERRGAGSTLAKVEVHTLVGSPANEIVWLAAHLDADAIVMGTHGRRGVGRVLLGSVAERVVRLAGCAVHVIREKAHNPAWVVPEIEPVCARCAEARATSRGATLWCARHAEHHVRAHVYSAGQRGPDAPHAWSASTGT